MATLLSACSGQDSSELSDVADTALEGADELLVMPGAPPGSTVVDGMVDAHQYIDASFARSGVIRELTVGIGDSVGRGQLLGVLESDALKEQLQEARSQRRVAQRTLPPRRLSRNGPPPLWMKQSARARQLQLQPAINRQKGDLRRLKRAVKEGGQKEATAVAIEILQRRGTRRSTKTGDRLNRERHNQRLYADLSDKVTRLEEVVRASRLLSPANGVVVEVNGFVGGNWNPRSQRATFRLMDVTRLVVWTLVPEAAGAPLFRGAPALIQLAPVDGSASGAVVRGAIGEVTSLQIESMLDDGSIEKLRQVRVDLPLKLPGTLEVGDDALVAFPP